MAAPNDTPDSVARIQNRLLREAGVARRATLTRSLSRSVIELSRRALRERMPGATPREVRLRWVELAYGAELAGRLAAYLDAHPELRLGEVGDEQ